MSTREKLLLTGVIILLVILGTIAAGVYFVVSAVPAPVSQVITSVASGSETIAVDQIIQGNDALEKFILQGSSEAIFKSIKAHAIFIAVIAFAESYIPVIAPELIWATSFAVWAHLCYRITELSGFSYEFWDVIVPIIIGCGTNYIGFLIAAMLIDAIVSHTVGLIPLVGYVVRSLQHCIVHYYGCIIAGAMYLYLLVQYANL